MQFARHIWVAACIGLGCCHVAAAGGPDDTDAWEEAQSLRELPAGIQALLGVGLGAAGGIADQGERFNKTDVSVDNLPKRRFALGIVHGDTAVVALEQGGRGYSVQTMEFRQVGSTWQVVRCAALLDVPRRGVDLLEALAAHPLGASLPCKAADAAPDAPVAAGVPPGGAAIAAPAVQAHVRQRPGA